jgi:glutamine amidotransferase
VTEGIPSGSAFYFVHSFYPEVADPALALGKTEYGVEFASVVARDNVIATQFHPEKSGDHGLLIYKNFVRWASTVNDAAASAAAGRAS